MFFILETNITTQDQHILKGNWQYKYQKDGNYLPEDWGYKARGAAENKMVNLRYENARMSEKVPINRCSYEIIER